ncbi:hypothetical protein D3C71_2029550 [compost metagenome]
MAVNAAIGQQSVQMQLLTIILGILHSTAQCFIVGEFAVANRLGDSSQVLINRTTCTDIQMTNFRITHLPSWQSHFFSASG